MSKADIGTDEGPCQEGEDEIPEQSFSHLLQSVDVVEKTQSTTGSDGGGSPHERKRQNFTTGDDSSYSSENRERTVTRKNSEGKKTEAQSPFGIVVAFEPLW